MNWLTRKRILQKYTAKYRKLFKSALTDQVKQVLGKVDANFINNYQKIIDDINNEKLRQAYIKLYKEVGLRFAGQKIKADPEVFEGMILNLAEIGKRIVLVDGYTKEMLQQATREAISQGLNEGMSMDQMVTLIRKNLMADVNTMATARAFRIALTEVGMAANAGSFTGLAEAVKMGIKVKKVWLTAPWGVSKTERHNLVPGLREQRPELYGFFNVGSAMMMYPGDPQGGVAEVINCKCALSWEVEN